MVPDGDIPGWESDAGGGSRDSAARSVADRLIEAWQIYRDHFRPILGSAVLLQGTLGILFVPMAVAQVRQVERLWGQMTSFQALTASGWSQMRAVVPFGDPAAAAVIGFLSSLGLLGPLLLCGSIAVLLLSPRDEDRTIRGALGAVLGRSRPLAFPVLLLGLVFAAGFWLQATWFARISALDPTDPAAFADLEPLFWAAPLLAILVPAIEIGVVYLVVRWAVAIAALVLEGIGLRSALRRSSELTRGRRLSVALLLAVTSLGLGLLGSLSVYLPTLAASATLGWESPVGLAVASIVALAGLVLTAPFLPIVLAILYRDFQAAGPRSVLKSEPSPAGWGAVP